MFSYLWFISPKSAGGFNLTPIYMCIIYAAVAIGDSMNHYIIYYYYYYYFLIVL